MNNGPDKLGPSDAHAAPVESPIVADRDTFEAELDDLRIREKAHTREGDAIAAARRRLPMVEIDPVVAPGRRTLRRSRDCRVLTGSLALGAA